MGIFKAIGKFFEAMDQEENSKNQVPRKSPEELANIISRKIAFNQRGVIG